MNASPQLVLLPDVERLVSAYLRDEPAVTALVADRVFTAIPAHVTHEPFVLIQRVGGIPPFSRPLVLDQADIQIDAWGGSKRQALVIAETVRQVLVALPGHVAEDGTVTACEFMSLRWVPDGTFTPPRPRYVFDLFVYAKPLAGALVSSPAERTSASEEGAHA